MENDTGLANVHFAWLQKFNKSSGGLIHSLYSFVDTDELKDDGFSRHFSNTGLSE